MVLQSIFSQRTLPKDSILPEHQMSRTFSLNPLRNLKSQLMQVDPGKQILALTHQHRRHRQMARCREESEPQARLVDLRAGALDDVGPLGRVAAYERGEFFRRAAAAFAAELLEALLGGRIDDGAIHGRVQPTEDGARQSCEL